MGADLNRHPPGNLAHRTEHGKAVIIRLSRLIGNGGDSRIHERPRELDGSGQMKKGEKHLTMAKELIFRRQRFFHFDDEFGLLKHLFRDAAICAPALRYSSSVNPLATPADDSTHRTCPAAPNICTPSGVTLTRDS
jgi:hypothetical protein